MKSWTLATGSMFALISKRFGRSVIQSLSRPRSYVNLQSRTSLKTKPRKKKSISNIGSSTRICVGTGSCSTLVRSNRPRSSMKPYSGWMILELIWLMSANWRLKSRLSRHISKPPNKRFKTLWKAWVRFRTKKMIRKAKQRISMGNIWSSSPTFGSPMKITRMIPISPESSSSRRRPSKCMANTRRISTFSIQRKMLCIFSTTLERTMQSFVT